MSRGFRSGYGNTPHPIHAHKHSRGRTMSRVLRSGYGNAPHTKPYNINTDTLTTHTSHPTTIKKENKRANQTTLAKHLLYDPELWLNHPGSRHTSQVAYLRCRYIGGPVSHGTVFQFFSTSPRCLYTRKNSPARAFGCPCRPRTRGYCR